MGADATPKRVPHSDEMDAEASEEVAKERLSVVRIRTRISEHEVSMNVQPTATITEENSDAPSLEVPTSLSHRVSGSKDVSGMFSDEGLEHDERQIIGLSPSEGRLSVHGSNCFA